MLNIAAFEKYEPDAYQGCITVKHRRDDSSWFEPGVEFLSEVLSDIQVNKIQQKQYGSCQWQHAMGTEVAIQRNSGQGNLEYISNSWEYLQTGNYRNAGLCFGGILHYTLDIWMPPHVARDDGGKIFHFWLRNSKSAPSS